MRPALLGALLSALSLHQRAGAQTQYFPEVTGTAGYRMEKGAAPPGYGLSAAEAGAIHQQLERIGRFLLAQPALSPPQGFRLTGEAAVTNSSLCPDRRGCPGVPVAAWLNLRLLDCVGLTQGQPVWQVAAIVSLNLSANDPEPGLLEAHIQGLGFADPAGHRIYFQPQQAGELAGFRVYRAPNLEMLLLTRSARPYWLPLSRESYLQAVIGFTEQTAGKVSQADLFARKLERHRAALAAMSPRERQAPARWLRWAGRDDPELAPPGSDQGRPLVIVNPDFLDRTLPRTNVQVILVFFGYAGRIQFDRGRPGNGESPARIGLYRIETETDWSGLYPVLTK